MSLACKAGEHITLQASLEGRNSSSEHLASASWRQPQRRPWHTTLSQPSLYIRQPTGAMAPTLYLNPSSRASFFCYLPNSKKHAMTLLVKSSQTLAPPQ